MDSKPIPGWGRGAGSQDGFGCLPAAETMSPSSHSALGHWGTAPIPQHVGALLPRSECHCVSAGPGRDSGLSLPWLPPHPSLTAYRDHRPWAQTGLITVLGSGYTVRPTCNLPLHSCFCFALCISYLQNTLSPSRPTLEPERQPAESTYVSLPPATWSHHYPEFCMI